MESKPIDTREFMSNTKFYSDYSRYNHELKRYETWEEAVDRVMDMHKSYYKDVMSDELAELMSVVTESYKNRDMLGAQRALQFGGEQLLKHQARLYNCASTYCDRLEAFSETMYLLLCGAGVGFSVQKHHIEKLPNLIKVVKKDEFHTNVIEDSIEGWSDAIKVLIESYTEGNSLSGMKIVFDYSNIRPKGSLISGGFKAPGHQPLKAALEKIEDILLKEVKAGVSRIKPIVAYDIIMHIADSVISGGVRRSATICMFSKDDEEMMNAKTGDWYVKNPQRGRSNNSCMLKRDDVAYEEFANIMHSVQHSGEPGFIFVDDLSFTLNPCVEVGMRPQTKDGRSGFQVCNLTEINGVKTTSKEKFLEQCKAASILGTLQAGYTEFKYLSKETKEIVDSEALIGVGITGMMNSPKILFDTEILKEGAEVVKYWNKRVAKLIGINPATRTTVIKPSGNASVLLGSASGIHGEHADKYIRHVQMNRETEMAKYFLENFPEMCETSVWNPRDIVIAYPVETPKGSICKKDLLGVKQLEYVKLVQNSWISSGKDASLCVHPRLTHNVSNTITVDDWGEVTKYIYDNKEYLCGVSMLAATGDKAYPQAPFTEVLFEDEIVTRYGRVALFTSALIEHGLNAYNNDLWTAINTAMGYGEKLSEDHIHLSKRDFVRRFNKFATNFNSAEECANCLKDVYNLHKWWRITKSEKTADWSMVLTEPKYTDAGNNAAQACAGGACEI